MIGNIIHSNSQELKSSLCESSIDINAKISDNNISLFAKLSNGDIGNYYNKTEIDEMFKGISRISKSTYFDFPNIGEDNCIYIDMSAESTYVWDSENGIYICIGTNCNKINIIDGGGANG